MEVLLTIDTEVHPCTAEWRATRLSAELGQYVHGRTAGGDYGLRYQLEALREYGLKAVFFIDALFALEVGPPVVEPLVAQIEGEGHEVQLHLHTEWLAYLENPPLAGRRGSNMRSFSEDEQVVLLQAGLESLEACGAQDIIAFRAGNFGADFATLRALARNGIRYDSSWNAAYLGGDCGLDAGAPLLAPTLIEGVWEVPIGFFQDYPGHARHVQLGACSFGELRGALLQAEEAGWPTFVIVSHSFELVWRRLRRGLPATPRRLVIRRFERLCRFLADNRDRFTTTGFGSLVMPPPVAPVTLLKSPVRRTVSRLAEQVIGRIV